MKTIFTLSLALSVFAAQSARADVVVLWNVDTINQFDVTISGSGTYVYGSGAVVGGWGAVISSPSGLWTLDTKNTFLPRNDFQPGWLEIENSGLLTYNGPVPLGNVHTFAKTQPYADFKLAVAPVQDGAFWQQPFTQAYPAWFKGGGSTIDITSIPDPNDPSTWTFTAHYYATVPEPGATTLGLLSLGMLAARAIARRNRP